MAELLQQALPKGSIACNGLSCSTFHSLGQLILQGNHPISWSGQPGRRTAAIQRLLCDCDQIQLQPFLALRSVCQCMK